MKKALEWCKQLFKKPLVVLYLTTYIMIMGDDVIVEEVVAEEAVIADESEEVA